MISSCTFDQATFLSLSHSAAKQARRFRLGNEEVQDVQQDAIIRLLKYMKNGNEVENPVAWISRAAHNICLDLYRKQQTLREEMYAYSTEIQILPEQDQSSETSITVLIEGEPVEIDSQSLQAILPDAIREDRNKQRRQVSEMWFLQEMSAAQIAAKTGLPQGTIRSHVSRFRQVLRESALAKAKSKLQ